MGGNTQLIIVLVFIAVFLSIIGAGIGLSVSAVDLEATKPDDLSTWEYIWSGLTFFVNLLTFRLPGVPTHVNMLFVFPFAAALLYIILKLARGGG